ncbi:hypothetical protein ACSNOI_23405 [Actinomadura kijaniata]|uniref:hypothetical protein n=1 Tax=Actinomadura kijaniata TaxID=46161 RepID=UPI003F1B9FD2
MTRADLLALTPDALAALANRGLVKRAAKDLDAGGAPEVAVAGDGTVTATFADGPVATLPPAVGLEAAACTCAATSTCRHIIGAVLAYQRQGDAPAGTAEDTAPEPAGAFVDWSPGVFDDAALARVFGERALAAARRTLRAGYAARLRRPTGADPVPSADLPTCTVRFLVPDELGYVHTDAAATARAEMAVLAVWAFRAADERGLTGPDVRLDVGGAVAPAAGSGLEPAVELAVRLLLDGAMHAGPVQATALRHAARDLTARDLHWPAAALQEIAGQLDGYAHRDAAYDPERFAALLAEVHARHRAAVHEGGSPRSQVLGTDEAAETPLRRVRLAALGCRVGGTAGRRTAEVFLAHPGAGVTLVLPREWEVPADAVLTGHDLAGRRISGTTLRALATGNVVSETAVRSAGRTVRLPVGRVGRTTVSPLGSAWADLPATLLVRDLAAFGARIAALPPRPIRPRVAAELVRVVEIAEVRSVGYHPGAQRLEAEVADRSGTTATLAATHAPHRPGALDALAAALDDGPRFVSAEVRRARGRLLLEPLAVLTAGGVVVPDLAPGDGATALAAHAGERPDPLTAALDEALAACADAAHRGLLHVTPGTAAAVERAAAALAGIGLRAAAGAVRAFGDALGGDDPHRAADAWLDAQLRLLVTAELR